MSFPNSNVNRIILNKETSSYKTLDCVRRSLLIGIQKAKPVTADNNGYTIEFTGGLGVMSSFNIFLPISSGTINIKKHQNEIHIEYVLKFTQLLIIVSIVVPVFFGPILIMVAGFNVQTVAFLAFAWLFLFGLNYVSTIIRFPRFIRKQIKQ